MACAEAVTDTYGCNSEFVDIYGTMFEVLINDQLSALV